MPVGKLKKVQKEGEERERGNWEFVITETVDDVRSELVINFTFIRKKTQQKGKRTTEKSSWTCETNSHRVLNKLPQSYDWTRRLSQVRPQSGDCPASWWSGNGQNRASVEVGKSSTKVQIKSNIKPSCSRVCTGIITPSITPLPTSRLQSRPCAVVQHEMKWGKDGMPKVLRTLLYFCWFYKTVARHAPGQRSSRTRGVMD